MLRPLVVPHFDFRAFPSAFVRVGFGREENGVWRAFAGVQGGGWETDEIFWSERRGAFAGVAINPPRQTASQLSIAGASVEYHAISDGPFSRGHKSAQTNFDPLLRVASGAVIACFNDTLYNPFPSRTDYMPSSAATWRFYNAQTGALVAQTANIGTVPDGSYLLWANAGAEWSAVRVVVGEGDWMWNGSVYPGPFSPLWSRAYSAGAGEVILNESNAAAHVHAFDPLARVVSAVCIAETDVRMANGQIDIPAGALLIAGIRASRNGPMTALWLLREDRTARLLGCSTSFSHGICECAKTNHFASDVQQNPISGDILVSSECDLRRYNPDATDVWNRLEPHLKATHGHPGGHCVRFPDGDETFWTEGGAGGDGPSYYNGLVYRVGTQNRGQIGSVWHGTNCADVWRGALHAVRQDAPETVRRLRAGRLQEFQESRQTIDAIMSGRWARTSQVFQRIEGGDTSARTWQRLKRLRDELFVFGFERIRGENEAPLSVPRWPFSSPPPDGNGVFDPDDVPNALADKGEENEFKDAELPTLQIVRDGQLQRARFDYFIRHATTSRTDSGEARLFVAARHVQNADGTRAGVGVANRVVEIVSSVTKICTLFDAVRGAFVYDLAEFLENGGDVAKLPETLVWVLQFGADAGGMWVRRESVPVGAATLERVVDTAAGEIRYHVPDGETLPYDAELWGLLCVFIDADGGVSFEIGPTCPNAQCAFDAISDGDGPWIRTVSLDVAGGKNAPRGLIWSVHLADLNPENQLTRKRNLKPTLWLRVDSSAPLADLSSYRKSVHFGREIFLEEPAKLRVDAVVILEREDMPALNPVFLTRRGHGQAAHVSDAAALGESEQ